MSGRPSLIEQADVEPDLTSFEPKKQTRAVRPSAEEIRRVADVADFSSRASQSVVQAAETEQSPTSAVLPRQPRTYRTGRNATFTTKVMPATLDAIYQIAERKHWRVGETIERAVDALLRSGEL